MNYWILHVIWITLSDAQGIICKPLNSREATFYEQVDTILQPPSNIPYSYHLIVQLEYHMSILFTEFKHSPWPARWFISILRFPICCAILSQLFTEWLQTNSMGNTHWVSLPSSSSLSLSSSSSSSSLLSLWIWSWKKAMARTLEVKTVKCGCVTSSHSLHIIIVIVLLIVITDSSSSPLLSSPKVHQCQHTMGLVLVTKATKIRFWLQIIFRSSLFFFKQKQTKSVNP